MSELLHQICPKKRDGQPISRASLPQEIVGLWSVAGYAAQFRFQENGFYYVVGQPFPYQISADGQTLSYGDDYQRTSLEPSGLTGVWKNFDFGEELHFRTDGTYTSHWDDGEEYFGRYTDQGNAISIEEMRAVVTVNGNDIDFDPPYSTSFSGSFTVNATELAVVFDIGNTVIYIRVGP